MKKEKFGVCEGFGWFSTACLGNFKQGYWRCAEREGIGERGGRRRRRNIRGENMVWLKSVIAK